MTRRSGSKTWGKNGERSFAELLDFHLRHGTRPKGTPATPGNEWTSKEFAKTMGETGDRNVRNWRRGRNIPVTEKRAEIEQALFGDNPAYSEWREELREAHRHAERARPTAVSGDDGEREGRKPCNLPFATLGTLFKGREAFMAKLHEALKQQGHGAAVAGKALHGLGGIGKTRLAIEYAWQHANDYSALLFVPAETAEKLDAGLAALVGSDVLDLPEKKAREDAAKVGAVLGWLERNPGWLMILDNVDDRPAMAAVAHLLPKLRGGQVLITGRLSTFPAGIRKLELGEISIDDATSFLLERTDAGRRHAADDEAMARELAEELGGLALGLEQAGAFIETQRIGFAEYLKLWRESRAKVVDWFDKDVMAYNHDVGLAATWKTSVDCLSLQGRTLLEVLAFFDPGPVPESLLDVPGPEFDARAALADLYAYSLATPAEIEGRGSGPAFTVHRLVQDFTRRGMDEAHRQEVRIEALRWINTGFAGNPQDVRTWPVLEPLTAHLLAIVRYADEAGIRTPTGRLMDQLGKMRHAKSKIRRSRNPVSPCACNR